MSGEATTLPVPPDHKPVGGRRLNPPRPATPECGSVTLDRAGQPAQWRPPGRGEWHKPGGRLATRLPPRRPSPESRTRYA